MSINVTSRAGPPDSVESRPVDANWPFRPLAATLAGFTGSSIIHCAMIGTEPLNVKSVEFKSIVTPNGQITVPPEIARQIPAGEQLQIVVLWTTPTMDDAWRAVGRQRFEGAYVPEDSVYEKLMDESYVR